MEKNFLNITPESGNGNQEVTIGLGYFLERVELIQLHKERFHLYIS